MTFWARVWNIQKFYFSCVYSCFSHLTLFVPSQSHPRTRWWMDPQSCCWWLGLHTTWPVWLGGPSLRLTSSGPRTEWPWMVPTIPRWVFHFTSKSPSLLLPLICLLMYFLLWGWPGGDVVCAAWAAQPLHGLHSVNTTCRAGCMRGEVSTRLSWFVAEEGNPISTTRGFIYFYLFINFNVYTEHVLNF